MVKQMQKMMPSVAGIADETEKIRESKNIF
jgi:hypothetical protein